MALRAAAVIRQIPSAADRRALACLCIRFLELCSLLPAAKDGLGAKPCGSWHSRQKLRRHLTRPCPRLVFFCPSPSDASSQQFRQQARPATMSGAPGGWPLCRAERLRHCACCLTSALAQPPVLRAAAGPQLRRLSFQQRRLPPAAAQRLQGCRCAAGMQRLPIAQLSRALLTPNHLVQSRHEGARPRDC